MQCNCANLRDSITGLATAVRMRAQDEIPPDPTRRRQSTGRPAIFPAAPALLATQTPAITRAGNVEPSHSWHTKGSGASTQNFQCEGRLQQGRKLVGLVGCMVGFAGTHRSASSEAR